MLTCQGWLHVPTSAAASRPPRRQRSDGERSRAAILREAARLATVEGLDGLSLARLAAAVGMSKSGLFAHFGSKEELQLATIDAASAIFDELVIEPAGAEAAGVPRLRAYIERFLDHVEEGVFPGGCFFVSAMSELDAQPGPVRDGAMAFSQRWLTLLAEEVAAAQAAGELDRDRRPGAGRLRAQRLHGPRQHAVRRNLRPCGPGPRPPRRRHPLGRARGLANYASVVAAGARSPSTAGSGCEMTTWAAMSGVTSG